MSVQQAAVELEIRRAGIGEMEDVSSVLMEASAWLNERGIPLWDDGLLATEAITPAVSRGEFYLARKDGESIGTFMLLDDDPDFWPDVPKGEATILHRLAVRRSIAGTGASTAMMKWMIEKARSDGKKYFRLDCMADRPKLRSFYERHGFKYFSDWPIYGFVVARYQLQLSGV
jgi:GNAT superfamily N-acetyltransferase